MTTQKLIVLFAALFVTICSLSLVAAETCYASNVVNYSQGHRMDGSQVDAEKRIVSNILGVPDSSNDAFNLTNFFPLGFPAGESFVTVSFNFSILNQPGNDIAVSETTFYPANYPIEKAEVLASTDGITFHSLGVISRSGSVDLSAANMSYANFVKIIERTNHMDYMGVDAQGDGYDLDAIQAFCSNETINPTPPQPDPIYLTINNPKNQTYTSSSILLNITSNGQITYSVDNSQNSAYSSPANLVLAKGPHTLRVFATTANGNSTSSSVSFTITEPSTSTTSHSHSSSSRNQFQDTTDYEDYLALPQATPYQMTGQVIGPTETLTPKKTTVSQVNFNLWTAIVVGLGLCLLLLLLVLLVLLLRR